MHDASSAHDLSLQLDRTRPNNTEIRAIAKAQGKNHSLAMQLWQNGGLRPRMLSLLMLDLKSVDVAYIDVLIGDIETADAKDQTPLSDWMIANVIMKKAALTNATTLWRSDRSLLKQRIFWSVQARSIDRNNHDLNEQLLQFIEADLPSATGTLAWNMNWCASQIGIEDARLRSRCIALGQQLRLYEDYPVSKECTSPYLPIWIGSVVEKKKRAVQ